MPFKMPETAVLKKPDWLRVKAHDSSYGYFNGVARTFIRDFYNWMRGTASDAQLEAAYDDPLGVTAAFNRNLLLHINRLTGTNFELAHWQHVGRFDTALSRIEMHLQARHALPANNLLLVWGRATP